MRRELPVTALDVDRPTELRDGRAMAEYIARCAGVPVEEVIEARARAGKPFPGLEDHEHRVRIDPAVETVRDRLRQRLGAPKRHHGTRATDTDTEPAEDAYFARARRYLGGLL